MSTYGLWGTDEDKAFAEIVSHFTTVERWTREQLEEGILVEVAGQGELSRRTARRLAAESGWTDRSIWRIRAAIQLAPNAPVAGGGTFLDRITETSAEGFVFDELALTLLSLCRGNMKRFREEVIETTGLAMPSRSTLSRLWRKVPLAIQDSIANGHRNRFKTMYHVRLKPPDRANDVWELDDFNLDIRVLVEDADPEADGVEVRLERDGNWIGVRPHLTLLIDLHSRLITGWMVLDHDPNSADVGAMFADAFEVRDPDPRSGLTGQVGGACDQVVTDNARAFTSYVKQQLFAGVPVQVSPAYAYTPIAKGTVERTGQTIQNLICVGLSGIVTGAERTNGKALFDTPAHTWLDFDTFKAVVDKAIFEYNYRRVHSTIGTTPAEAYIASNTHPRVVPDAELAARYLPLRHKNGGRIMQHTGVSALKGWWVSPDLSTTLIGEEVSVRRLHHRLDRLAVFYDDEFEGWVFEDLNANEAGRLIEGRKELSKSVNKVAARTREAMEARTETIGTDDEMSLLDAAQTAIENRKARGGTGGGATPPPPQPVKKVAAKTPGGASPSPKPVKKVAAKTPGGKKPASRPAKQTSKRSTRRPSSVAPAAANLAAREAALASSAKPKSKSSPLPSRSSKGGGKR